MKRSFKKILVIGAGPVVIGQSSELDYAGVQICRTLKEENIQVVVLNSNPATVMTDKHFADTVYVEPIEAQTIRKILETEHPDGVLALASGKKGIELCLELEQNGEFKENGAELLDIQPDVLQNVSTRRALNELLKSCNVPYLQEEVVNSTQEAEEFVKTVGFPVSVRTAFSADAGKFIPCNSNADLSATVAECKEKSMLGQVAVQKCITGYKEINVQCVRDANGDCAVVGNSEYMEAIGIHSGDSIAVLPAQTLPKKLLEKMEADAKQIAETLSLVGTCFVRFAVNLDNAEYIVFDVDVLLSRVSALVSKAAKFPLATVCAKLSLGYYLKDLEKQEGISAPQKGYWEKNCCVRIPKWSFENFGKNAYRSVGETMKSTGEIFALGADFTSAFYKALLSLQPEKPLNTGVAELSDDALIEKLYAADDMRVFVLFEALKRDMDLEKLCEVTHMDRAFLVKLQKLAKVSDSKKEALAKVQIPEHTASNKKSVLVVGAGPTSIGLGTDRDFAACLSLKTLSDFGMRTVVINNNPAANTTSNVAADAVYIEPVTEHSVEDVVKAEKPQGAILAFGGGNAIRKSELLRNLGVEVYGPDAEMHRTLKNKLAFGDLLDKLCIRHTDSRRVLVGKGAQIDVLSDGQDILIPGICEHVEKAKVHSGDSLAVYPSLSLNESVKEEIVEFARRLCCELQLKGILNMQFVVYDNEVYVIAASVVATRNIPFMTKATGLPITELATRLMLGETLRDLGLGTGLYPEAKKVYVRVPVFSFEQLEKIDVRLGDDMRSTGEVVGVGTTYDEAVYKGFMAAGMRLKRTGGVMISVADSDKPASVGLGNAFLKQGFKIYATANTAKLLNANHVAANAVRKIHEGEPNILHLILQNKLSYLVSTAEEASSPNDDDVKIRRTALLRRIPVLPSVEMALALTDCLEKNDALQEMKIYKQ